MRSLLNRLLLSLALGHFAVDVHANILPVMLPFLRSALGLSYAQTALVMTCYSATSSLAQPLFGYLSDRFGGRLMLVAAVVWMVVFMSASGAVAAAVTPAPGAPPSPLAYLAIVGVVTLAGIGSAAYHPQAAALARRLGGRRVATAVSIFSLGGIAGFSISPMLAATAFGALGLVGTLAFLPFGLLAALALALGLGGLGHPQPQSERPSVAEGRPPIPVLPLLSLLFVVVVRAWVEFGVVAYTPLRFPDRLMYSSQLLFFYLFGEALGTFVGAIAADHLGRRRVVVATTLLLAPAMYLYNTTPGGPGLFAAAAVAGLLLGASVPVTIVVAQELLPRNVGVASGLMMGFAFGMGGLGVVVNGVLADHYGLATSLGLLAALPLLGALVASSFPASMEGQPRTRLPEPAHGQAPAG